MNITTMTRKIVKNHLSNCQCIDCGEKDISILEFDHLGDKKFDISEFSGLNLEDLKKEIDKCVVRCRNCHRKKHMIEKNVYKYKWLNGELKLPPPIIHKEGTKVCLNSNCKKEKPYSEFGFNKNTKDGYNTWCRECDYKDAQKYYLKNKNGGIIGSYKPHKKLRGLNSPIEKQIFLCEYLSTHPCVDCGEKNILVLEFDHIKDKGKPIDYGLTLEEIKQEIDKCNVRCGNCHMKRHKNQGFFHI